MPFICPQDAEIYFEQVKRRCREFIRLRIWTIELAQLDAWLGNFSTAEEKYLAAYLLDQCLFRNENQIEAMIAQMLQRTLGDALASAKSFGEDWQEKLSSDSIDPGLRIVPVIREDDSPAKSGPLVARLYRRLGKVCEDWMIWPWQMLRASKKIKTFLLIDDFVGSGEQFGKFCSRWGLGRLPPGITVIYAPLIAHTVGINAIKSEYPSIKLVPGETLDDEASIFSKDRPKFDPVNDMQVAKSAYRRFWSGRNISLKKLTLGYGELALALAFNHGTPNCTLPIFWLNKSGHSHLFRR